MDQEQMENFANDQLNRQLNPHWYTLIPVRGWLPSRTHQINGAELFFNTDQDQLAISNKHDYHGIFVATFIDKETNEMGKKCNYVTEGGSTVKMWYTTLNNVHMSNRYVDH